MPLILLILLLRQQPVADHADPLHLVRDQLKVDVHAARHVDKMASTVPAQMWAKPGADVCSPDADVGGLTISRMHSKIYENPTTNSSTINTTC